jgi:hypothetical protein
MHGEDAQLPKRYPAHCGPNELMRRGTLIDVFIELFLVLVVARSQKGISNHVDIKLGFMAFLYLKCA